MTSDARTPVIVAAVRTPIGRLRGALAPVRPDDLASHVVRHLAEHYSPAMEQLEDVYFGAANQAGEDNRNVARMASLLAGLPVEIPGVTVNRLCGSGMEAIIQAAKSIMVGEGSVYIAGGVESMTRAPYVMPKASDAFARDAQLFDTALGWRMTNPAMERLYGAEPLGITAENVAERYHVSRADQDAWALGSHTKAAAAQDEGWFDNEIVPVEIPGPKGADPVRVTADESVRRDTTLAALAKLKPVFKAGGSVTAGNSSPLNDGAAALLITSAEQAHNLGLRPMARIAAWGHAGVAPGVMGIGPVPASRRALKRAGLQAADLGAIELNEAFAVQTVASIRSLDLDPAKVNPGGGAIALGHPLGCSGARITATLAHGMARARVRWGLASMCIGVGQGIALVLERT
ncbi:acetyl-CoA C-acyltransferase [Nannocystis sp. ILAH1]|uniref:thiolase family protein n=1 Tax=unclassified Nannocystis TaxID=2627009 RepID=UPI00226F81D0|nr:MULTISPECIES: acetyl-CoA C-acyltransferase [unclassified Nannocystis]MCY0992756.1 acetyl-CoA C-acyltransferase [Nannocystis sp. ILAH1]MCY1070014.1 acetyl-CoA C-acyltransferase [Nannocystis sp. RBIL2]